jgi:hypothetical protein
MIRGHLMNQTIQMVLVTPTASKDQLSDRTILPDQMRSLAARRHRPAADPLVTALTSEKSTSGRDDIWFSICNTSHPHGTVYFSMIDRIHSISR